MVDTPTREAVAPLLRGRFGREYAFVPECPSTQRLIAAAAPEGAVAVADYQTEGRGRLGRRWEAPPGTCLLASIQLRPRVRGERLPELSLVAGRACAAVVGALGVETTVKFPNDVLVGGRKVAGILAEATDGRVVLGVGVNVNVAAESLPAEVRLPATSLLAETGREHDRRALLAELLLRLEREYDDWNATAS